MSILYYATKNPKYAIIKPSRKIIIDQVFVFSEIGATFFDISIIDSGKIIINIPLTRDTQPRVVTIVVERFEDQIL